MVHRLGDVVETKPGVKTMGGWSGEGVIVKLVPDPKQPDNPVCFVRPLGMEGLGCIMVIDGNELKTAT